MSGVVQEPTRKISTGQSYRLTPSGSKLSASMNDKKQINKKKNPKRFGNIVSELLQLNRISFERTVEFLRSILNIVRLTHHTNIVKPHSACFKKLKSAKKVVIRIMHQI